MEWAAYAVEEATRAVTAVPAERSAPGREAAAVPMTPAMERRKMTEVARPVLAGGGEARPSGCRSLCRGWEPGEEG